MEKSNYNGECTIKKYGENFVFVNREELEWLENDRKKYFQLQQLSDKIKNKNNKMIELLKYIATNNIYKNQDKFEEMMILIEELEAIK